MRRRKFLTASLLAAMAATIVKAAEKAADPPLVPIDEMLRSDIKYFAGGITWIDTEWGA